MEYGGLLAVLIGVGLWMCAVRDVLGADDLLTRRLAKSVWLELVLFLPFAGGIAWLLVGRPKRSAHFGEPCFRTRRLLGTEEFSQFVAGLQRASAGSSRIADQR